ncbi:hypothetical protein [Chromobacterium sp. IIBBL 290-4]|uniref:hypothetical protein n=1 Tax=Chromobacterium sp. IIBBL 290-4 TaxID=2953890 RepID=UPI0020B832B5|nr:hypothetical protein [Chromobacterium sp. IIBBL 290-4]UTH75074.1 hypothetical protein NKT35_02935 [Chromobacterium sp. IIBBL 290-4]
MAYQVLFKVMTILGMCLVGVGTVLLWRGSPSGYAPSALMNDSLLNELKRSNRRMLHKQWLAISLIVIGTVLQFPTVIMG